MITVAFYHQTVQHPMRKVLGRAAERDEIAAMLALGVASVRHQMPDAALALITGDEVPILPGIPVEPHPLHDPAELQLDRTRAYRNFVAARVGQPGGALFLDTDILVTGPAGEMFELPFDAALTYLEEGVTPLPERLDHWGLPADGRLSAVNFGVMAMRYTVGAVQFLDAVLQRFDAIVAEGRDFLKHKRNVFTGLNGRYRIADVRTWGGGQFAMTSLMSPHLFRSPVAELAEVDGAAVRLLPATVWNYTPPDDIGAADFAAARISHFKGMKKHWMPVVAQRLGLAPLRTGG